MQPMMVTDLKYTKMHIFKNIHDKQVFEKLHCCTCIKEKILIHVRNEKCLPNADFISSAYYMYVTCRFFNFLDGCGWKHTMFCEFTYLEHDFSGFDTMSEKPVNVTRTDERRFGLCNRICLKVQVYQSSCGSMSFKLITWLYCDGMKTEQKLAA